MGFSEYFDSEEEIELKVEDLERAFFVNFMGFYEAYAENSSKSDDWREFDSDAIRNRFLYKNNIWIIIFR